MGFKTVIGMNRKIFFIQLLVRSDHSPKLPNRAVSLIRSKVRRPLPDASKYVHTSSWNIRESPVSGVLSYDVHLPQLWLSLVSFYG